MAKCIHCGRILGSTDLCSVCAGNREYEYKNEIAALKAELKENQQISDRISTLIMERDGVRAKYDNLLDEIEKMIIEWEERFEDSPDECYSGRMLRKEVKWNLLQKLRSTAEKESKV